MSLLRKLANVYRKKYPDLQFSVRRLEMTSEFGRAWFDSKKRRFIIEICSTHDESLACFILAHEMAHAVSWYACQQPEEPHGRPFWDAYEKTYAIYEKFCDENS